MDKDKMHSLTEGCNGCLPGRDLSCRKVLILRVKA